MNQNGGILSEEIAAHATEILKAVAHPVRLRIVSALCGGREHVSGLADRLGVSQATISQQLRFLRLKGLVDATRESGFAYYRLVEPNLRDLIVTVQRCCPASLEGQAP